MKRERILKTLFVTLVLGFSVLGSAQTTSTLSGTITDPSGNPLNGTLTMRLPVPAQYTPTNLAVAPSVVSYTLVNGVITGTVPLYDVAALQPKGLYYIARAYDQTGALQFYGNFVVTGASFNLGAATPTSITTSNISYLTPAFLSGTNTWTGINTFNNSTIFNGPVTFNGLINGGQFGSTILLANQSPTGTTLNTLTLGTGAPATAIIAPINTTAALLGVTTAGAGVTGSAVIQQTGIVPCVFDGATTALDYVTISATTAGQCHDAAIAPPTKPTFVGEVVGQVLTTNVGGGTYNVVLGLQPALPPQVPPNIVVANAGATGTTVSTLTKLTGAPSTAVIAAITDTGGVIGITTSGAGTTGNATIQTSGLVNCVFDGATTAGDYVALSTTTAGNCHDTGAVSASLGPSVLGRVLSSNGGGGTYQIDLFAQEMRGFQFTTPSGCSTATTCTVTVTWPQTWASTAYHVVCFPTGFGGSAFGWLWASGLTTTQFTLNFASSNATSSFTSAYCEGRYNN